MGLRSGSRAGLGRFWGLSICLLIEKGGRKEISVGALTEEGREGDAIVRTVLRVEIVVTYRTSVEELRGGWAEVCDHHAEIFCFVVAAAAPEQMLVEEELPDLTTQAVSCRVFAEMLEAIVFSRMMGKERRLTKTPRFQISALELHLVLRTTSGAR